MTSAVKKIFLLSIASMALMARHPDAKAQSSELPRKTCVQTSIKMEQNEMYVWVDNNCSYIVQLVGVDVTVVGISVNNFRPLQFMEPGMGMRIASCTDLGYLDCSEMGSVQVFAEAFYIPVQGAAESDVFQVE